MQTKLIEFNNNKNKILRGILTLPDSGNLRAGLVCLHGFERCSSTEKKFKKLADKLAQDNIAVFRFDLSGCGLSDGDFKFTTIKNQGVDLFNAIEKFRSETNLDKINIMAHSLGSAVLAEQINDLKNINKIILLSPALNQKDLLRYWFVTSVMKKINPDLEINWKNYKKHLNEEEFIKDCNKTDRITKVNYINPDYFLSAKDIDYSNKFKKCNQRILHIHGSKDMAVPPESLNIKFNNQIIVEDGDHDLEKPNLMNQWLQKVVDFLLE